MSRVVIAGAGNVGQALARRLAAAHVVRGVVSGEELPAGGENLTWHRADLTAIPEAEVALAGAQTVVMLAQARRAPARLTRAAFDDLDRLLADSVARAAKRVGAAHVVLFACGEADPRAALLEAGGVPVSVLRGGGPDPVAELAKLVDRGPGEAVATAAWSGGAPSDGPRGELRTCSVQRYRRPPGWSALQVARAYFTWLAEDVPGVRTSEREGVFRIEGMGVEGLVLRVVQGRSEPDSVYLEVADGALAEGEGAAGRFEFRVLLDQTTVMAALIGYRPAMPWPLYRMSQAPMHERVMRRFGQWLEVQAPSNP